MEIEKKGYVEKVIAMYNLYGDEGCVQDAYRIAVDNCDGKIFYNLYSKSNVKPAGCVLGLMKKVFGDNEKLSKLLEEFN